MTFYDRYKYFVRYWLPVLVWAGMIFYLSSMPLTGGPGSIRLSDKLLHSIEFFSLSFILFRAFSNSNCKKGAYFFAILLTILYSCSDELHQLFVPGRVCDIIDLLFDSLGSVLIILFSFFNKKLVRYLFFDFDKIKISGKRAQE